MKDKLSYILLNFVTFARVIMGITFEDFQALIVNLVQRNIEENKDKKDNEKDFVKIHVLKSRQCGGSFVISSVSLILCLIFPKVQVVFSSYIQSEASLKISLILSLYDKLPSFIRDKNKLVERNKRNIVFENGSRINSFGATSIRGISSDTFFTLVLLDEYNFFPKHISDEVYNSITPLFTRSRNGALIVMSTPFRKDDMYYKILQHNKSFIKMKICWYDMGLLCNDVKSARELSDELSTNEMVEKFGTKKLKDIYRGFGDNIEQFEQEFCCKFPDFESSYIKLEEIERCINLEKDYKSIQELKRYDNLYFGYDIGKKDLSVITIMNYREDGIMELVYKKEMQGIDYTEQEEFLSMILEELEDSIAYGLVDGTGVGDTLYDFIKRKWGEGKVGKVHFTLKSKTEMVNNVKVGLQKKEIELIPDTKMINDILKIKRILTKNSVTFDADRDSNGHADRFWSLALCVKSVLDCNIIEDAEYEYLNINFN